MKFPDNLFLSCLDRAEAYPAVADSKGGAPGALLDRCPHRSVPLSFGKVADGRLQCGYHGWAFDAELVVIAQVQGIATAAGCQLVAWCDMAVAEEGARFATPGVKIGLFCTTPMVALTRAIGRKAAMEMLMTGRYFPADEAKGLGLVNKVVPLDQLADETSKLAHQIVEASGLVIGIGKQAFYAQVDQADAAAWNYAKHTITLNNMAEDAQNGIKAFLNKDTPEWRNR